MSFEEESLPKKMKLDGLQLIKWNLCHEHNSKEHHTEEYEHSELIVRRGQAFKISASFNLFANSDQHRFNLIFNFGANPKENKGTTLKVPLSFNLDVNKSYDSWRACGVFKESELDITVVPSYESLIGKYSLSLEVIDGESNSVQTYPTGNIYVLFNPWCDDDEVFMEIEDEREEYVLNEVGCIWQGSYRSNMPTLWNFGQFDDVCLDAALYLMDCYGLKDYSRGNPVLITRCISAMVNSNDDNGVLTGRWEDPYPKGSTVPWAWTGSVEILEKFMKNKISVEYGQCWVFAGVATSLLRALGIPTRVVSNFESLHDNDKSLTCDIHWDENDDPLDDLDDSVWNYHVWNESFFKRRDLPAGYDGWQAHDATPQETSGGTMKCGPAPLKAIKEGHVYLPYDVSFIFAEVNGDKCHWMVKKDGTMECVYIEEQAIGKSIKTKRVGSLELEDVTLNYKYSERSTEERDSMQRAFAYSSRKKYGLYDDFDQYIVFSIDTPDNNSVQIGDNIQIYLKMKNIGADPQDVSYRLSLLTTYYTGKSAERIKSISDKKTISPQEELSLLVLDLKPDEYKAYINRDAAFKVYVHGRVLKTNKHFAHQESFVLTMPPLNLRIPDDIKKDEPFNLTISFKNPFGENLTDGEFHIEAAGFIKSLVIPAENIDGLITGSTTLTAKKTGRRTIVARFSSDQLSGLAGSAHFKVRINYANMY